jgi:para-nitrobenzyl esterase
MRRSILSLAAAGLLALAQVATAAPAAPLNIDGGAIARAVPDATGVSVYKGLPYAAPPVGPLRWKPPQPIRAWTGVRATDTFGPDCVQGRAGRPGAPERPQSEDCLFVNVWTAAKPGEQRPVLVWIHGGGSIMGSGAQPEFDGAAFARKGVVLVTINYRLGLFGFLSTQDLSAESGRKASGNYGFMDDIAALKWVQRNIKAFGGDPAKVTIAGESSGSVTNSVLMVSPQATGLFRGVIGESGSSFRAVEVGSMGAIGMAAELDKGRLLQDAVGAKSLEQLRAVPAKTLLEAAGKLTVYYNRPVIDGYILPMAPWRLYDNYRQNDVHLIVGWNREEGSLEHDGFTGPLPEVLKKHFGSDAAKVGAFYPVKPGAEDYTALKIAGDDGLGYPTWWWGMQQATHGSKPVFVYEFDHAPPIPAGWFGSRIASDKAGAYHGAEIVYAFNNLGANPTWKITDDDRRLADQMSSYWANFVKTGDPNGPGLPAWPRYQADQNPKRMELATPTPYAEPDPDFRRFSALHEAHMHVDPPEPVGP